MRLAPVLILVILGVPFLGSAEPLGAREPEPAPAGMVLVPAGSFLMGTDAGEEPTNESPAHKVTLKAFWIDRYEVTNKRFAAFVEAKGYESAELWSEAGRAWLAKSDRKLPIDWEKREKELGAAFGKHPVVGVSWFEADAFARFAKMRLPTEPEWERAARGTDGRKYPWGNAFERGYPEEEREDARGTVPIGTNSNDRSAAGVFDLGGNVSEWTASWFAGYPGTKFKSRLWDETAPRRTRVVRGGSWRILALGERAAKHQSRVTYRIFRYPCPIGSPSVGFRLARDEKVESGEKAAESGEKAE